MEKYDVCDVLLVAGGGEYPNQDGFGWTNGVLRKLLAIYSLATPSPGAIGATDATRDGPASGHERGVGWMGRTNCAIAEPHTAGPPP